MAELFMAYDGTQPAGQRFAPEVRAEIAVVAPSVVNDDSITTAKLHSGAVTAAKMAANAVTTAAIADDAVTAAELADDAVGTAALAAGAVTMAEAGNGVAKATDKTGTQRALTISGPYTSAEYGAIVTPDPNTIYAIT